MAVITSDKLVEEEAKVNQDDQNLETSKIPLESSWYSDFSTGDWYLCYESGNDENDVGRFDDGEEDVNVISDWVVSDDARSSTSDEEFPVTIASLPVGFVLSVKDKQVVIEGKGKHYLLSIGSFLWITETRDPLGYVDEVFGTVEKPCFSVSLKSESHVPEGIRQGTEVSLIVADSIRLGKTEFSDDEAECEQGIASEEKPENDGNINKVLDLGRVDNLEAEQPLPSLNPSDSQTDAVTPQDIPETGVVVPQQLNPSDSQTDTVTPQAIPEPVAPVPQEQPLPPAAPERPKAYVPPRAKQMGIMPNPVPTQAPERMTMPMRYPQQNFRNGQSYINNQQQNFGLHQRYQSGVSWRQMKSNNPYPPHRQIPYIPPPTFIPLPTYNPPPTQPPQSQRINAGLSSGRGMKSNYRGGGTGFIGRGRALPQPK